MGFLNFLGVDPMSAGSPGFAGGFVQPVGGAGQMASGMSMIEGAGGLENALAQNKARGNALVQNGRPRPNIGIGDILALAGDVLRARNGFDPIYQDRRQAMRDEREKREQEQQQNEAFANYLGDPELVGLIRGGVSPGDAMKAHEFKNPKAKSGFYQELLAAGFDPAKARAIMERRYSRPIIVGSAATGYGVLDEGDADMSGGMDAPEMGGGEIPTINSQEEYDAFPGGQYRDSQGNIGVKRGGPTASPSGVFPGQ